MAPSATDIEHHYERPAKKHYDLAIQKQALLNGHGYDHMYNGTEAGRILRKETLKRRVDNIDTDICEAGQEDAFFVADMGEVYRQHLRWKLKLKRVKPHYGMFQIQFNLEWSDGIGLTIPKLSSAILILKSFGYWQRWTRGSIAHPRPK